MTFVIPNRDGRKRKIRNICRVQEHDWEGQYHDGWLFLDCKKCEANNIQYQLSKKQAKALFHGWDVNRLYIYVDRYGNHTDQYGELPPGYLECQSFKEYFARPDLQPV